MQIEYNEKYGDDNKSNNNYNSASKELKSTQKKRDVLWMDYSETM